MDKENARLSTRKRINSDRYPLQEVQEGFNDAKQAKPAPNKALLIRKQLHNVLQSRPRIHSTPSSSTILNTASRNQNVPLRRPTIARSTSTSRHKSPVIPSRSKSPAVASTTHITTSRRKSSSSSTLIASNSTSRSRSPAILPKPTTTSKNKITLQQATSKLVASNSTLRKENIALNLPPSTLTGAILKNRSTLQQHKTSLITTNSTLRGKSNEVELRPPLLKPTAKSKMTLKQPESRLRSSSTSKPLKGSHELNTLMRKRSSGGKCMHTKEIESETSANETHVLSEAPPLPSPYESPKKVVKNKIRASASLTKTLQFDETQRVIDESTYTITTEKVSVETCKTSITKLFGTNLLSALPNFAKTASNLRSPSVECEEIAEPEGSYEGNKIFGLQAINDDIKVHNETTTKEDSALQNETSFKEDISKQDGSFEFNVISRFMSFFHKSKPVPDYELPPLDLEDINERELFLNMGTDEFVDPSDYFVLVTKCIKSNEDSELKYFQYWRNLLEKQIKANKSLTSTEIVMKFLTNVNSAFNESNAHLLRGKVLKLINGMETKKSMVYITRAEVQIGRNTDQNSEENESLEVKNVTNGKQPAKKHTLHQKLIKRSRKNEIKDSLQIEYCAGADYLWEYRDEIDEYLRSRQENLKCPEEVSLNFMARLDLLNWVVTMQKQFYLSTSMYFMVVRFFDYVLASNKIRSKDYKIIASSLIWIITKCYGVYFLKLSDFERLCNIKGRELLDMEKRMLKYLNFKLTINEPAFFAAVYLDKACISLYHQVTYATFFIMETFTYTPRFSQYEPSAIASSAVYLGFELLLPKRDLSQLKKMFSPSDLHVLNEISFHMREELHKLSSHDYKGYQGTVLKYSGENLKEAASEVLKSFK